MSGDKLSLAYSPCPNDCFIFDALANNKIETGGFQFDVQLSDVEKLNRMAFDGTADITKLSFHAYAYVSDKYIVLNSGSALGFGCGPLVISKKEINAKELNSNQYSVAIPGKYTTANFLFSMAFPESVNKKEMLFSDIEKAVCDGDVDAGVIIHESRFTYAEKGLKKIIDLGNWWEFETQLPIPLGCIAAKRSLGHDMLKKIDALIRDSVAYAFANPYASMPYIKQHAQELNEQVIKEHIKLYVNNYTLELGEVGENAINEMFEKGKKIFPNIGNNIILK